MTSLIDLKLQNDRVEQAIAHMTDILLLIRTERQPERNELLWQIYGRARLRMNTESARLHHMIEQLQVEHKERNEMRSRMISIVGILLVALLLVGGMAVAQDTPLATNGSPVGAPTNTAIVEGTAIAATEEAPIVAEQPPVVVNVEQQPATGGLDSRDLIILALLLSNGVLITVVVRDKNNNKELIPPSVVFALFGTLKDIATRTATTLDDTLLAGFEDVAKRLLTTPPPAPASPIPTIPDPDPFKPQYPVDADPGSLG